ncbi:PaaI family thioesterase [Bombilactobacillus bombi]|uniref:PaaI family thioesterase n=1 Tax=Bombilactobacillus bombi TaxID=1303590 RepID=UPI0015E5AFBE|nr:PaaI family thioesterase [Bombilactobacillus bombi]MBA1433951.1 PaaI family thioesterase [Bombilactobacillus bombi]
MNLIDYLNIKTIIQTPQKVVLQIPVSDHILQPYGLVHGGINAVLAETAASMGANLNIAATQVAIGTNINTTHLRPVKTGLLKVQATPIKLGHTLQVWQAVTYQTQLNYPTSYSNITLMIQNSK